MSENYEEENKYVASMVLAGVGDCLAYNNGDWEFQSNGQKIHEEILLMGGLQNLQGDKNVRILSDDTIMLIATAEGIEDYYNQTKKIEPCPLMYSKIGRKYQECLSDMQGRAPGATCIHGANQLVPSNEETGHRIDFNSRAGGCGAAMRSMCIGLLYSRPHQIDHLIALSTETGRMTHHLPTGWLGSVASAYFVHCALNNYPIKSWGHRLLELEEKIKSYIQKEQFEVENNMSHWNYFWNKWRDFVNERNIDGKTENTNDPRYSSDFESVEFRDQYYLKFAFSDWPGSSGHDAPLIAYDSILYADKRQNEKQTSQFWEDMCNVGFFHGGDSDSTAVIAGAIYGALFGFNNVPKLNYENLEYLDKLTRLGKFLYQANKEPVISTL